MIKSFRHKGLAMFWTSGDPRRVKADLRRRVKRVLQALDAAEDLRELPPGFRTHPLQRKPRRYAMDVNGPWRITFEWEDGHAVRVDLEQYH